VIGPRSISSSVMPRPHTSCIVTHCETR
jgi:hypothetical protein